MNALPASLSPDPSDSEDVVSALETADVFWTKGDADEAIRWLKRAAESASDAGNDERALAIARTVADLKSGPSRVAEAPSAAPPANRPSPPSTARQPPPPPSALRAGAQENSEVRRAPSVATPPKAAAEASPPSKTVSQKTPPPLPSAKTKESTPPPATPQRHSSIPPAPPAPKRPPSTNRMAAVTAEPTRTAPPAKAPNARRSPPVASMAKEPNQVANPATAYKAVAVYVKTQERDGDRLEVIIAKPGQTPPPGAEPALLVPTRSGGRLLG